MRPPGAMDVTWRLSLILAGILALGCADQRRQVDAVATDSVVTINDAATFGEQSPQIRGTSDDPFRVFGGNEPMDVIATISLTPVWLINNWRASLVVTAAGGAATVLVDTLGAADSVLVRIETRADSVTLSARSLQGDSMGTVVLRMDSEPKRAAFPQ